MHEHTEDGPDKLRPMKIHEQLLHPDSAAAAATQSGSSSHGGSAVRVDGRRMDPTGEAAAASARTQK
eukprot:CAMPEP_0204117842 /NCGR_PEP_ID=MMETSP0361-20130328/6210_1 /ASSEMBLY_ACC=CAM_ASM_000343 /TAXON_ID=268821 /ORGANISM="Scrippsiella Hangoei, Strain SHTV-5" /LENGTH=66 /DNA_ID=CAMNT_0051068793 /DNA_START=100 /DNA_END=297 /DNA_ORIENTATION=+